MPALSPDGHTVAFLREEQSGNIPNGKARALWISDCNTGEPRPLLPSSFVGETSDDMWVSLDAPHFSPDGSGLYVSAYFGGDSGLVHRVDVLTGRQQYLMPGELIGVIHDGPFRGHLLATQHTTLMNKDGSEYGAYPVYVFRPDGKVALRIPDSESWNVKTLKAWLKGKRWQVQ